MVVDIVDIVGSVTGVTIITNQVAAKLRRSKLNKLFYLKGKLFRYLHIHDIEYLVRLLV